MTDLAGFLLARFAEDEAVARASVTDYCDTEWRVDPGLGVVDQYDSVLVYREGNEPFIEHIARHDPARVLAECDAKRRIVEVHALVPATDIWGEETGGFGCKVCDERADLTCGGYEIESSGGCATLRLLALPYADHEDFWEEWKP